MLATCDHHPRKENGVHTGAGRRVLFIQGQSLKPFGRADHLWAPKDLTGLLELRRDLPCRQAALVEKPGKVTEVRRDLVIIPLGLD